MNITSNDNPDCPDWMKRFNPTDIKWLDDEKTIALCAVSDNRYRLRVVWTKDGTTQGTGFADISDGVGLEKMQKVFDSINPSNEVDSMAHEEIVDQIRAKLAA